VRFREGCLDGLAAAVQGRRDALVFPRVEHVTPLLPDDHPLVAAGRGASDLPDDVDPSLFTARERDRATGPLQVTHGDVARAVGYCHALRHYQRPAESWRKAREDRAFRWLLRTRGTPVDVPGVHRIRHAAKGRYRAGPWSASRRAMRRMQDRLGGGRTGR